LTYEIKEIKYYYQYEGLSKIICQVEFLLYNNTKTTSLFLDLPTPYYFENLSITDSDGKQFLTSFLNSHKQIRIFFEPFHPTFKVGTHRRIIFQYCVSFLTPKAKQMQFLELTRKKFHLEFEITGIPIDIIIKGNKNFDLITSELFIDKNEKESFYPKPIPFCKKNQGLILRSLTQNSLIYQIDPKLKNCYLSVEIGHILRLNRFVWYLGGALFGGFMIVVSLFNCCGSYIIPIQAAVIALMAVIRGWLFTEHQSEITQNPNLDKPLLINHHERHIGSLSMHVLGYWVPWFNYLYLIIVGLLIIIIIIENAILAHSNPVNDHNLFQIFFITEHLLPNN